MLGNKVRFIIVSKDILFCMSIKQGLIAFSNVDLALTVPGCAEAENKLSRLASNIILVDVDTARVDSLFLNNIISRFSGTLVVLTAAKEFVAKPYLRGAISDFVPKPAIANVINVKRYLDLIMARGHGVAASRQNTSINYKNVAKVVGAEDKIVAIASSTGGVEALEKILAKLPANVPPLLLVQHMPSGFTKLYADRLNGIYPMDIKEAQTGDFLLKGQMLIAPAGNHMKLVNRAGRLTVECFLGPKMHGVIPAADILFDSVANLIKDKAVGVILTGMGADGAKGLRLMHNNGAKTIGQNEETCVVYGMPKVAKNLGAVDFELPIDRIAEKIMSLV